MHSHPEDRQTPAPAVDATPQGEAKAERGQHAPRTRTPVNDHSDTGSRGSKVRGNQSPSYILPYSPLEGSSFQLRRAPARAPRATSESARLPPRIHVFPPEFVNSCVPAARVEDCPRALRWEGVQEKRKDKAKNITGHGSGRDNPSPCHTPHPLLAPYDGRGRLPVRQKSARPSSSGCPPHHPPPSLLPDDDVATVALMTRPPWPPRRAPSRQLRWLPQRRPPAAPPAAM